MNARKLSIYMSAVAAAALFGISGAAAQNGTAITGLVTSPTGPMEGVLVTAKKDGAKVAITVVTDEKGRYSFPASRLEPGKYNLRIRATGFYANGRPTADVAAGNPRRPTSG
jgi:hypothetical protein